MNLTSGSVNHRRSPRHRRGAGALFGVTFGALLAVGPAVGSAAATEGIPELPEVREVDGATGSLLNRNIGTGEQPFCADLGARLEELGESWAVAVDDVDPVTANRIRLEFTNIEAANFQCLTAVDAALTSSGNGSLIGS